MLNAIASRILPPAQWHCTDDTEMALSLVSNGADSMGVSIKELAQSSTQPATIYLSVAMALRCIGSCERLLVTVRIGRLWREVFLMVIRLWHRRGDARRSGRAYFSDDLDAVVINAALAAQVTHTHSEAIAGAIATAVAVAMPSAIAVPLRLDSEILTLSCPMFQTVWCGRRYAMLAIFRRTVPSSLPLAGKWHRDLRARYCAFRPVVCG